MIMTNDNDRNFNDANSMTEGVNGFVTIIILPAAFAHESRLPAVIPFCEVIIIILLGESRNGFVTIIILPAAFAHGSRLPAVIPFCEVIIVILLGESRKKSSH
jgi:3-dehydroquinate dehydratase